MCRKGILKPFSVQLRDPCNLSVKFQGNRCHGRASQKCSLLGAIKEQPECRYERVAFGNEAWRTHVLPASLFKVCLLMLPRESPLFSKKHTSFILGHLLNCLLPRFGIYTINTWVFLYVLSTYRVTEDRVPEDRNIIRALINIKWASFYPVFHLCMSISFHTVLSTFSFCQKL